MKQNNEKYFYSKEQDKVITDFVNNDFKEKQKARREQELIWELNMNFYVGNQYSYITPSGFISDIEKSYTWENREVYNHIAPIIENRLSKLNKIKPTLNIRPKRSTENNIYKSKLANAILQANFYENNFEELIRVATHWSEITGTSFYKITWEDYGKNNSKLNGNPKISVCSPFEIYPDSNFTENIEECNSIIEARAYPVEEINNEWGLNLAGDDINLYNLNNFTSISNISGRSNYTKLIQKTNHNYVIVLERYEKPSVKNPNGKLTIVCKDKLLYDGDMPYLNGYKQTRIFPFVKQISSRQLSSFWGSSIIERCIPMQKAYNAIKNRKHEFLARLASGVLTVEDGSVDVDNLELNGIEPGKIIIYRNGSTPPKFLDPGSIPQEFEREEEKLLAEINNLACISEITTSASIPTGVNSATALSLLMDQDETRLSPVAEAIRNSIKEVSYQVLRLYQQFSSTLRVNNYTNNCGKLEMFYWTKNDIGSDSLIIDTDNQLDEFNLTKKEMLLKLLERGVFLDSTGQLDASTKEKILALFGFDNWRSYDNMDDLHKLKAENENNQSFKLDEPMDIDNHKIHIDEHTKFIINSDGKSNLDFINKLQEHIKQHKIKLKEGQL